MPTPSKQFLFFCLVFVCGIGLAGLVPGKIISRNLWWFSALILSLSLTIIFWSVVRVRLVLLAAFFLFFGLWRYSLNLTLKGPDQISFYNNQKVELIGTIASEPDERVDQVRYELGGIFVASRAVKGKLLLVNSLMPLYNFGDRVSFSCKLKAPLDSGDFSYSRYLARYDIYSICYFPEVTLTQPAVWSGIKGNFYSPVYRLKTSLRSIINQGLPEPEAALANGMILGDQKSLPADLRAQFSRTGLSHIIAISGMNITIIAAFISWLILTLGFSRRSVFYLAGSIIALYIILIGAPASAVRAGLISGLFLGAMHLGRLSKINNALVFAAAVMLLFSPRLLRDDLGFILSFLAIFSLVFFYEPLDRWLVGLTGGYLKPLRQAVSLTLAAQILTWPVMAYNFSQISLVAPLANLAALWTLPILTAAVFLILPLAGLLPPAAIYLFLPARIILQYLLAVVHNFAGWQFAAISLDFKYPLLIMVYYSLIAWYLVRKKIDKKSPE
jgi:competence protein ComEC